MSGYFDISSLRLEVEVPPDGLVNLAPNPDGATGAWGWVTPVADTRMDGYYEGLKFFNGGSQACYFATEMLPALPGKYFTARYDVVAANGCTVKTRFSFYDSARTLISQSAQSAPIDGTVVTRYTGTAQAPAGTAFAQLRFDVYSTTGGTPPVNATFTLTNVMVISQDTGTVTPPPTTNLIRNPSFEAATDFAWTYPYNYYNTNLSLHDTAAAHSGTYCCVAKRGPSGRGPVGAVCLVESIKGGKDYTASAYVKAATVSRQAAVRFYWYDLGDRLIGDVHGDWVDDSTSEWVRVSYTATAPSRTARVRVGVVWQDCALNERHYLDDVILTLGSTIEDYFDGNTPDTADYVYAWSGTADSSTSTRSAAANTFDFAGPVAWQNILGPTSDITVQREELNVGTLTATVRDALLDPATVDTIRPGKRVRLRTMVGSNTAGDPVWESVFEGRTSGASTSYDKTKTPGAQVLTTISLEASDNLATLANYAEPRVVGTIPELADILEGKGVPWNIDGSGNQGSSVTVATNDSGSAVDAIAVVRDSNLGYAWVDRNNVLQAWDSLPLDQLTHESFETGDAYRRFATNWYGSAITGVEWSSADTASEGTHSLKFTASGDGKTGAMGPNWQPNRSDMGVPVAGGQKHRLSFDVKTAVTREVILAAVWWQYPDTVSVDTDQPVLATPAGGVWTPVTWDLEAPVGAIAARIALLVRPPGGGIATLGSNEVCYFDNFRWAPVLDESTYSGVAVDFSTDTCINSVTINYLRYNIGTGATDQIPYGPYADADSISTWGVHQAEFTICLPVEDPEAIEAYANSILAANAKPAIKCHSLTAPARSVAEMSRATLLDLGSPAHVVYADKVDSTHRVVTIEHTITATQDGGVWLTSYGFDNADSVAQPTIIPAPSGLPGNGSPSRQSGQLTLSGTGTLTGTITFPKEFATAPEVVAVCGGFVTNASRAFVRMVDQVTTTDARVTVIDLAASPSAIANLPVTWIATV